MAAPGRRLFRRSSRALPGLSAALALLVACALLAGCTENYPRSTLAPVSEFARTIDDLFETITFWGVVVFVLVETALVYAVLRYRRRPGVEHVPEQVHGHTRLEIAWTIAPALILAFIAVPTIRTIFITQDEKPIPGALNVRVLGHQWWWEFEYPELEIVTANELHVPVGRTVSFQLETADVIHSFWVPRLGGKRDLTPNHKNQIWFTPESTGTYLGQCAEFCGLAHALMGFRVVVDSPEDFEAWAKRQRSPAVGAEAAPTGPGAAPQQQAGAADAEPGVAVPGGAEVPDTASVRTAPAGTGGGPSPTGEAAGVLDDELAPGTDHIGGEEPDARDSVEGAENVAGAQETAAEQRAGAPEPGEVATPAQEGAGAPGPPTTPDASDTVRQNVPPPPDTAAPGAGAPARPPAAPPPSDSREPAATPEDSLARTFAAVGDPARGAQLFQQSACVACHTIRGTNARGRLGPDLTHVGSRQRIAAELLPNTPEAMAMWLRDPPRVKPGAKMPNLNLGEDQVADLVAYLQSLQ